MATSVHKQPQFPVGSLVNVRGRDWVVLPSDDEDILALRPLSGSEVEACGVHLGLEGSQVQPAQFPLPSPNQAGDFIAGRLVRNAARLSLRSGAGPFRSLGRLSVRPRPYQFVPLIMALRLDPVRMLIADDVGVGKTIEAALIARELLDRGDAQRLCVICPPHLCDQWQTELDEKFHIHAAVVRTSTWARLERDLPRRDTGVFQHYPHIIVSIDFVKRDTRRGYFLAHCPDLVIVDEVHTATQPGGIGSGEQQQRHELVHAVASKADRHLILLTATPHSGVEGGFRSLLGLLSDRFANLDMQQLTDQQRRVLARHFVQRTRADVTTAWPGEVRFPKREPEEKTYSLVAEYKSLFDDVLAFTRETVQHPGLSKPRQRVRYWAALTLLRSLMSSPAAAARAFAVRESKLVAAGDEHEDQEDLRSQELLDPLEIENVLDSVPEAPVELGAAELEERDRRRLREFTRRADSLKSENDPKIKRAEEIVSELLKKGFSPIIYCRFIPTARYVASELERRLTSKFSGFHVKAITGEDGSDEERKVMIADLVDPEKRGPKVLVATDCLSEGINLQDDFDAVIHYDLPWNPNRLEQREGRVDRFGQQKPEVRAVLLYSPDNQIDGIVLRVLVRKAREIYKSLGVSVPVPIDSESVVKAVINAVFEQKDTTQPLQHTFDFAQREAEVHQIMDRAAERERISRSRFAQHAIDPLEVAREVEAADNVLGDPNAVEKFLVDAAQRLNFRLERKNGTFLLDPTTLPSATLAERLGWKKQLKVVFDTPQMVEGAVVIGRNHPLTVSISERILGEAFRPEPKDLFARCGAAYTDSVKGRTGIALLRVRYHLTTRRHKVDQFAEEVVTAAFSRGTNGAMEWLPANDKDMLALLEGVSPKGQISQQERTEQTKWALEVVGNAVADLDRIAGDRAKEIETAYDRLRETIGSGAHIAVEPYRPDLLGIYVLVPGGAR